MIARRSVRAAWVRGRRELEWVDREVPLPLPPGSLLMSVSLAGVCGTDVHIVDDVDPLEKGIEKRDVALGHEFVGRVVAGGDGVSERDGRGNTYGVGDRIVVYPSTWSCGRCYVCRVLLSPNVCQRPEAVPEEFRGGGFADGFVVPPGSTVYRVPDGVPDEIAVLTEPLAGVSRAVERAVAIGRPDRGDGGGLGFTVVVLGAGAIGAMFTALWKGLGAFAVVVGAPQERLARLRAMGADVCIPLDPVQLVLSPEQRDEIKDATPWRLGADVVIDASGSVNAFEEAIELARPGGTVVEFGAYTYRGTAKVSPSMVCRKDLQVVGSNGYGPRQFGIALRLLENPDVTDRLRQISVRKFDLRELEAAIESARRQEVMKVLVESRG